ncbi:MAG: TIGR04168 family protein [Planctomycetes bacterium]|nr:TIGR04168 family protein [Planctomycetota bacterium]MCB9891881.1 TIGR04168 family protein [Planctomycetota bacterium]MCB9919858.1 TIGR04168 family protein [Planctomycetota bacterium]
MREPTASEHAPTDSREIWFLGDLHGHFDEEDRKLLCQKDPALTVFVGDLGDEDPKMARRVAELPLKTGCILGNHDAWLSFRTKAPTEALLESLEILGDRHLAYASLDLDALGVSVIGARPFSWGGPSLRSPELYSELYGVLDHESSAAKIVEVARGARYRNLVIVAHNGPYGLGKRSSDIFGKDFGRPGGDWGDLDLQLALRKLEACGFEIPLVVAGHMHHLLFHPRGEFRKRCLVTPTTVYVNIARVPRIFRTSDGDTVRHYASARFDDGKLIELTEHYVREEHSRDVTLFSSKSNETTRVAEEGGA